MCFVSTGRQPSSLLNFKLLQAIKPDTESIKRDVSSTSTAHSFEDSDTSAYIPRVTAPKVTVAECAKSNEVSSKENKCKKKKKKRNRKRKKLQPGLTATKRTRMFIEHDYHDHANDPEKDYGDDVPTSSQKSKKKTKQHPGGVIVPFPLKLHTLLDQLEQDGLTSIMSWQPHGRAFVIRDKIRFTKEIMPKYFKQTRFTSFQRQLNLYGYVRLSRGADNGAYYHELFLRGKQFLCKKMTRTKNKGTGLKAAGDPDAEPDFFTMPFVEDRRENTSMLNIVGSDQHVPKINEQSIVTPSKTVVSIGSGESQYGTISGSSSDPQKIIFQPSEEDKIQVPKIPSSVTFVNPDPEIDSDLIDDMILEACLPSISDAAEMVNVPSFSMLDGLGFQLNSSAPESLGINEQPPIYDYDFPIKPVPLLAPVSRCTSNQSVIINSDFIEEGLKPMPMDPAPLLVPINRRASNQSVTISSDVIDTSAGSLQNDDDLRQCLEMLLD
eukprot:CAMPEP_0172503262 /NCGR_PEP_ID=MMETSP1066-20121228/167676_1 /TAXON_ID=671091 /ORGANISM="Coscinodiscus wailesii, Strain CCMP2513" /LENGTH=493 /DNA_ID=CAMNT_0013278929 /DNA_START=57 /DNA_END=1538 /DNA_ORIENTATION=+